VCIEDRYDAKIDDLWSALTDPGRLARWYGQVEGVDEPYDEVIEATLTADGDQTIMVIETRGMPLDLIAFYGVGYQIHAENLAAHLAGRERCDMKARWDELVPPYQGLAANVG
jgi:hypothetical protein